MGAEMCAMLCPSRSRCASVIEPPPPSAPPRAAFADEEWLLPTWKVVETRGVIFDEHSGHRGWGTASQKVHVQREMEIGQRRAVEHAAVVDGDG